MSTTTGAACCQAGLVAVLEVYPQLCMYGIMRKALNMHHGIMNHGLQIKTCCPDNAIILVAGAVIPGLLSDRRAACCSGDCSTHVPRAIQ